MLTQIQVEIPACDYHKPDTLAARQAAEAAVMSLNSRVAAHNESLAKLLQADPAGIDPANVFNGSARKLHFELLTAELKARRLVAEFFKLHRRDSQTVVQALPDHQGAVTESERTASAEVHCGKHYDNINRLSALESQLREIVANYLAV